MFFAQSIKVSSLLLNFLFFAVPGWSASATLNISLNSQDVSGKTITVEGKRSDEQIKASFVITNTSGKAVQVKVRKTEIITIPGTLNAFCLGECFPPAVLESPNPLQVAANASTPKDLFYAEYYPNGQAGISEIRYEVFDITNNANTVWVVIRFDAREKTGSALFREKEPECYVFPNPAQGGQCTITIPQPIHRAPDRLVISGPDGRTESIKLQQDHGNRINVSLEGKADGISIISLFSGNKLIISEKLIIVKNR